MARARLFFVRSMLVPETAAPKLSSGLYFYRIKTEGFDKTMKMMMLK